MDLCCQFKFTYIECFFIIQPVQKSDHIQGCDGCRPQSILCSKICPIFSWEFPEMFTYYAYAVHFSHYICVMLKGYLIF